MKLTPNAGRLPVDPYTEKVLQMTKRLQVVVTVGDILSGEYSGSVTLGAVLKERLVSMGETGDYSGCVPPGSGGAAEFCLDLRFTLNDLLTDLPEWAGCDFAGLPEGWKQLRSEDLYSYLDDYYAVVELERLSGQT